MHKRANGLFSPWSASSVPSTRSSNNIQRGGQSTQVAPPSNCRDTSPCVQHCYIPSGSSTVTPSPSATPVHHTSAPQAAEDDPVIGQVTISGRFTCLHKACRDDEALTFNRHADFKRHYTNMHGRRMIEYFCSEQGCQRSKNPADGRKGRSFKGRRDKMKEHMEAVHGKYETKRRRNTESEGVDEDNNLVGDCVHNKRKLRRQGG